MSILIKSGTKVLSGPYKVTPKQLLGAVEDMLTLEDETAYIEIHGQPMDQDYIFPLTHGTALYSNYEVAQGVLEEHLI